MPIYEFYCPDCHTVFSFLARTPRVRQRPSCPSCGRPRLNRRPSSFAVSRGLSETAGPDDVGDSPGLERAMEDLAREAEGIADDDPRGAARLMRRFHERAGMPIEGAMDEALRRLEAGEDPDRIEQELGDALENETSGEDEAPGQGGRRRTGGRRAPRVDRTLYEL